MRLRRRELNVTVTSGAKRCIRAFATAVMLKANSPARIASLRAQ
jgi:hypothetical protein